MACWISMEKLGQFVYSSIMLVIPKCILFSYRVAIGLIVNN